MFGKLPEFYERSKMDVIKKTFRLFFVLNEAYKWPKIHLLDLEGKKLDIHLFLSHLKRRGLSCIVELSAIFRSFYLQIACQTYIYTFAMVTFIVLPFVKVYFRLIFFWDFLFILCEDFITGSNLRRLQC